MIKTVFFLLDGCAIPKRRVKVGGKLVSQWYCKYDNCKYESLKSCNVKRHIEKCKWKEVNERNKNMRI